MNDEKATELIGVIKGLTEELSKANELNKRAFALYCLKSNATLTAPTSETEHIKQHSGKGRRISRPTKRRRIPKKIVIKQWRPI